MEIRNLNIKTGAIYHRTKQALDEGFKVVINKGGTASGKSEDLIRIILQEALRTDLKNEIITITSESYPHLDVGTIRMLENICAPIGWWGGTNWNKSKSVWTSPVNNNIIEFLSADRIGKALGARRRLLFGNELNNLKLEVWDEMARRSEIILADFNPTSKFWLEDWMKNYDHVKIIISNYLDNPFLSDTERGRIEKRAARDNNFRRVHIDCEYGIFEGLVFEGFTLIDEMPNEDYRFGLDWGFTNDPSAIVKVIETPDEIYADELLYRTGMLNRDIITFLEGSGIKKNYDVIVADSAEPKSIKELHMAGFNILPAVKGPDSIRKGIDIIKSKKLFVTKRSLNLIKELRNYSWQLDKEGKATNKPIDANNHLIDSLRYSLTTPKKQPRFMKPL